MHKCQFCKKTLSTNSALNLHQRTTKYCLIKQGKNIINNKPKSVICNGCYKSYSNIYNLAIHKKTCKEQKSISLKEEYNILKKEKIKLQLRLKNQEKKTEKRIKESSDEKDTRIRELEQRLDKIAEKALDRPTTTTTTNNINDNRINQINNLTPLTDKRLLENVEHLTIEHIKKGAPGYTQYAVDYPLKNSVLCVDFARRKAVYKDEHGNIINDPGLEKLAPKFFSAIEEHNAKLIDQYVEERYKEAGIHESCTEKERNKYPIGYKIAVMNTVSELYTTKRQVCSIANGGKEPLSNDFTRGVCAKTS